MTRIPVTNSMTSAWEASRETLRALAEHCSSVSESCENFNSYQPRQVERRFSTAEAARLTGVAPGRLRALRKADGVLKRNWDASRIGKWAIEEIHEIQNLVGTNPRRSNMAGEAVVLAVIAPRMGIGNTTVCANLAVYLAIRGYRTLLVDLDVEGSAIEFVKSWQADSALGLQGSERFKNAIHPSRWSGLDVVGLHPACCIFFTPPGPASSEMQPYRTALRVEVDAVADRYDVVLLHGPGGIGAATMHALFSADALVIPFRPTPVDLTAAQQLFSLADHLLALLAQGGSFVQGERAQWLEKRWRRVILLLSRVNSKNAYQAHTAGRARASLGHWLMHNAVVECEVLKMLGQEAKSIYEVNGGVRDRRSFDRAVDCVDSVNAELEDLISSLWPSRNAP